MKRETLRQLLYLAKVNASLEMTRDEAIKFGVSAEEDIVKTVDQAIARKQRRATSSSRHRVRRLGRNESSDSRTRVRARADEAQKSQREEPDVTTEIYPRTSRYPGQRSKPG